MKPNRHQQIEKVFHEALDRPPEERDAFIRQACGGDEALSSEVKSLLGFDERAADFISESPADVAAAIIAAHQTQSMLGRSLGHYRILSPLGAGGMGEVFLAEDTKLGRKVAIKLLHPESLSDEHAGKRLLREAQAAAKLDHPNICIIHEVREEGGYSFIVMQYVEGEALSSRIQKGPLKPAELLNVAVQVADALREAHSREITHRDIKPQNIMVTPSGQAKVLDFGLAKLLPEQTSTSSDAQTNSLVTEPGMIIGTVPYMSPEQVKGQTIDARSDLFSLGAVFYEMATGKQPFAAGSMAETLSAILREEPEPLARYARGLPSGLQRIVAKCLEKDKSQRYQSAGDLLIDLGRLKTDVDSGAAVTLAVWREKGRRRWILPGVALVVVALASIGLYFLLGKKRLDNDAIRSLAIMPFVNASNDPNAEYLSDGITENLIDSLSQLSQLKVIARTTAFRYKGSDPDPQALGRDLSVNAVVTGKVFQQGDNLIVQADLLSTADGSQVWGARYTRKLSDVFAVQEQIAREIAANLKFKLTGAETQALSKRYTENINAYQDYSIGLTYLRRRTSRDFFTAIGYFEKAIAEEPNYALAYAALTEAYTSVTIRGLIGPAEGRRKIEEAARNALSLDPNLAESHVAIAEPYLYFPPYNFSAGDREVRLAIELNPGMALAYQVLGASLMEQGRLDEALGVWAKAREIDPLSPIIARLEAFTYLQKGDYPRSLELLRRSKELAPPFIVWGEIEIYIQNGKLDEVLAELERAKLDRKDDPYIIYSDGMAAATQGARTQALQNIKELERMSGASLHRAIWIAMIYSTMNDRELALRWLERGLDAGAIIIFYKDAPVWDAIRSDPRFQNFLRRMGIPQ
jgi:serine/threonine protein kinase/tetratricopeptide (TPR) repeat protein